MRPEPTSKNISGSSPAIRVKDDGTLICPICHKEAKGRERYLLYGEKVCRKCYYGFANKRHVAFVLDVMGWIFLGQPFALLFTRLYSLINPGNTSINAYAPILAYYLLFILFISFRDGFRGHSPGKYIMGVQIVDQSTLTPAGFYRSFIRNLPISFSLTVAFFASALSTYGEKVFIALLVYLILLAYDLQKGPRLGDKLAKTKVIWKKHRFQVPFDQRGLLCGACGYNLTGNVSGVCPECGTKAI